MKTQKCRLSILHLPWHRRKVCGTVSEADGKQIANVRVTLEKKNINTLDREKIKILAAHVDMGEGEEENIFAILQVGCCNVETKRENNKYITDAAI